MDSRYVEFEDILQEVGGFGKYQKYLLLFLIPVSILSSFQSNTIHLKLVPDHWCRVNELSNFSFGEQHRFIRPVVRHANHSNDVVRDQCLMFDIDYRQVVSDLSLPQTNVSSKRKLMIKDCDNGWVYDKSHYWDSYAMHFDFVCENSHKFNVITTVRLMASIFGTPLYGLIADLYGRRLSYLSILITSIVSSMSPILCKEYTIFIVCQCIIGLTYPSSHLIILIMIIEFMCPKDRVKTICCLWIGLYLGTAIHSMIIYYFPHWVWITILNTVSVLPFIFSIKFIPESLQWLLLKTDYNLVEKGFKNIMQTNRKSIEEDLLSMQIQKIGKIIKCEDKDETERQPKHVKNVILKFLRETTLFQILLILTLSLTLNLITQQIFESKMFVFYEKEILFDHILWSLIKIPAILITWFLMQRRIGRRLTNAILLALIGLNLIVISYIDNQSLKYWLSLFGLYLNTGSLIITSLQLIELSPTTYRCSILTTSISIATLIVTSIKYIYPIDNYDNHWLYLMVLSAISLVISFLSTFMTETLRENTPQNVLSAEELLNSMKYWKLGKRKCDLRSNIFKSLSKWDLSELQDNS